MSNSCRLSTEHLERNQDRLKGETNRESTRINYHNTWTLFNQLFIQLDRKIEKWKDRISLFATYLVENGTQSPTVKSYCSAIKTVPREEGKYVEEDSYVLSSLIRACKVKNDVLHTRLPIQQGLLGLLVQKIVDNYTQRNQPYLALSYKAILITSYHGTLRVGEITKSPHAIGLKTYIQCVTSVKY